MPYISVQGHKLYFSQHEEGPQGAPPLVLIHGAGGTHLHWPPELRRLPGHTIYALDLPGHGRSEGEGCADILCYRDVVLDWADALGIKTFVPMGHSMGGAITIELALGAPDRLCCLILVATGARLRVHPKILQGLLEAPETTAQLLAEWAYGERPDPQMLQLYVRRTLEIPPSIIHGDFAACNQWDRMQDIIRIQLPTLIIGGEADRLTPPKYLHYLHDRIPNSQLVLIPGAGHMVMLEAPGAVCAAVQEFLAEQGRVSTDG